MISFKDFRLEDGSPIYAQILLYIKRGVASGEIRDGDELPSRRVLSALLGVNPNTVQKAYRILEEEDLVASRPGAKSVITIGGDRAARIRDRLTEGEIRSAIAAMRQMGLSKAEALALIDTYWQ